MEDVRIDNTTKKTIESLVEDKLRRLYAHLRNQNELSLAVKKALRVHAGTLTTQQRELPVLLDQEVATIDWQLWLSIYRSCLDDLVALVGNPGHIFLEKLTAEMRVDDNSDWHSCDN